MIPKVYPAVVTAPYKFNILPKQKEFQLNIYHKNGLKKKSDITESSIYYLQVERW